MHRGRPSIAIVLLAVFPLSCLNTGLPVKRFRTQENAGSVAVSIQSIAPFDEQYIEQLQPKFDLPADAVAIAQTQIRQIQQLRALMIQAGLGLPSSTVSETKTTTVNPDENTVDFTKTETTTPPTLDSLPSGPAITDTALPEPLALVNTNLALDTALNYRALAALKQEIALLNRYVRDAAVTRGTRPYVVRLLVTLNPSARFEPYDAYTTISLFSQTPTTETPQLFGTPPATTATAEEKEAAKRTKNQNDYLRTLTTTAARAICGRPIETIPLFVTDNIESSLDSVAGRRAFGLNGAVEGIVQNVAGNLGANFQSQDVEKAQARTLNSLQTISRLAGNTFETRLGAMHAAGGFQTLARTYNVTVLALVPTLRGYLDGRYKLETSEPPAAAQDGSGNKDAPPSTRLKPVSATQRYNDVLAGFRTAGGYGDDTYDAERDVEFVRGASNEVLLCDDVSFSALSRFTDAHTGISLRSRFDGLSDEHLRQTAKNWGLDYQKHGQNLEKLLTFAQYDAYDEFADFVRQAAFGRADLPGRDEAMRLFWLDFVSIARHSGRFYGRFALPQDGFEFFSTSTNATLIDDGTVARLILQGSKNLSRTALDATLEVNSEHVLPASSITVQPDGRRATFEFPSPSKIVNAKNGPKDDRKDPTKLAARIVRGAGSKPYEPQITHVWPGNLAALNAARLSYVFLPETPKPKTAAVTMDVTAPHVVITTNDAGGTFAVAFRSDPKENLAVRFNVDGGYIVATDPQTEQRDADRFGASNRTYVVTVRNLSRGDKLTVNAFETTLTGEKRGTAVAPKTIDVIPGSEPGESRRGAGTQ